MLPYRFRHLFKAFRLRRGLRNKAYFKFSVKHGYILRCMHEYAAVLAAAVYAYAFGVIVFAVYKYCSAC